MIFDRTMAPSHCCQSAPLTDEEWAARTARLASAAKRAADSQPTQCPACGCRVVVPLFEPISGWECGDRRCAATWTVQP